MRSSCLLVLACLAHLAGAQEPQQQLTLRDALRLARERNGVVRAAYLDYLSAASRVRVAQAAFLPTLTPELRHDVGRIDQRTGPGRGRFFQNDDALDLSASLRLLDSGERAASLSIARRSAEAVQARALQTLRETLFQVHQQYYDVLRSQELFRVQQAQVARANLILQQTEAQVEAGTTPQKDTLQARADALNAAASELESTNQVSVSQANLKATLGLPSASELPQLASVSADQLAPPTFSLGEAFEMGTRDRADLTALRRDVEAQQAQIRLARIQSGITFSLDASASRSFTPNVLDRSGLALFATMPLYDGARTREIVRQASLARQALEEDLKQSERNARAQIEAAYKELELNIRRIDATSRALEAARINYEAAVESQRLGAANIIAVSTAQVSLVTAESNSIQASYDALTSHVRLLLTSGQPIPGEEL